MGFMLCLFWHVACDHMSFKSFFVVLCRSSALFPSFIISLDSSLDMSAFSVRTVKIFHLI